MDLKTSMQAIAAAASRDESHPSAADLVAYQADDLDEEASERLQDHLATCGECARAVLDLARFPDREAAAASEVTPAQVAKSWQSFRARLEPAAPPAVVALAERRGSSAFRERRAVWLRVYQAAAAVLLLSTLGLALQLASVRRQLADPRADVQIVSLSTEATRSGDGARELLKLAALRPVAVLSLAFGGVDEAQYEAAIKDRRGKIVWSGPLGRQPAGNFTLQIHRRQLPPDLYEIELRGGDPGQLRNLATYRLQVEWQ